MLIKRCKPCRPPVGAARQLTGVCSQNGRRCLWRRIQGLCVRLGQSDCYGELSSFNARKLFSHDTTQRTELANFLSGGQNGRGYLLKKKVNVTLQPLQAFEFCFTDSPLGGGIDPFSRGSLFSQECDGSGGSVHRGQAREAVAGARNLPVHRGRGDKASRQGSQLRLFDSLLILATV